jgi:HSP20 family protein
MQERDFSILDSWHLGCSTVVVAAGHGALPERQPTEGGTIMRAMMPWTEKGSLLQEMERLFDRYGDGESLALGDWAPRLDLSETRDALIVKVEVPAIDPKEIQVSIMGDVLTVKGEKKEEKEDKEEKYHRVERTYGSFSRSVRLPIPVDQGKVSAAFKNGLLTVTLPKTQAARSTAIPIKTA